jgi:hypothetical protein
MSFFVRFLIFGGGLTIGLLLLKYMERIVYNFGKSEWAEQRLGTGGTYRMWQLIALGIIVASLVLAFIV